MTFEEAEKLHRELWGWLAETGSDDKWQWPGWKDNGGKHWARNRCFACQYMAENGNWCAEGGFGEGDDRERHPCPVQWSNEGGICQDDDLDKPTVYDKWERNSSEAERKRYAAIIRDLPWTKKD